MGATRILSSSITGLKQHFAVLLFCQSLLQVTVESQLLLEVDASRSGVAPPVVVVAESGALSLGGVQLPSGSSSLSITKISLGVGTEVHTVAVLAAVPAMFLPSCRRSLLRFVHSLFVASCGLRSWALHQID